VIGALAIAPAGSSAAGASAAGASSAGASVVGELESARFHRVRRGEAGVNSGFLHQQI